MNDVEQDRQIEDVFGDAVERPRGPRAVAVPAQIERVDVIVLAQGTRHPIPVPGMIQPAVNQHQRRLRVLTVVPELELQAVRIEEVRDRFHFRLADYSNDCCYHPDGNCYAPGTAASDYLFV